METWISENDFGNVARRGIAVEHDADIFFDDIKHRRVDDSPEHHVGVAQANVYLLIGPLSQIFVEFIVDAVDERLPARFNDILGYSDGAPPRLAVS